MENLPDRLPETPTRQFVEVPGCTLSYLAQGRGAPMVFLHGMADHADSFRLLSAELVRDYQSYSFDLPGCGGSSTPQEEGYGIAETARHLAAAFETLSLRDIVLVGQDRGALLALFLGLLDPSRIRAVCLLSASLEDIDQLPLSMRLARFRGLRWLVNSRLRERSLAPLLQARYDLQPPFFADRLGRLASSLERPQRRALLAMMLEDSQEERERLRERLQELKLPVLLLQGDRDGFVSKEEAQQLQDSLNTAILSWIERCGHSPHEETPNQVAKLLRNWLASLRT